jgi:hypothetical protein
MKQAFKEWNFRSNSRKLIKSCAEIIDNYTAQGLRLTLRQLYYQLVSRGLIPNKQREYMKLSELISNARLAGIIDWNAIEDRVRTPRKHSEFDDIVDLINSALQSYRLDRWKGQDVYTELWVEKDALAGILKPIADEYHITLMVNRGYSSQTAMHEAALRIQHNTDGGEKESIILYVGDLDPSGEDMVRDITERLKMFGCENMGVLKLALNPGQVKQYKLPPNPVKPKDPRSESFFKKFGQSCWEVDALPPEVLVKVIRLVLEKLVDREKMDAVIEKEEADKNWLQNKMKLYNLQFKF